MVLSVSVNVKDIVLLGRNFPWTKPGPCPRCQSGMWWHGFVLAYFSCCPEPVYLRRLRCPGCGAVHRLKPAGYFPRFRSLIREIKETISHRCCHGHWRPDLPRARQRQWWRRLGRNIFLVLGLGFNGSFIEAFTLLIKQNIIPVTSAGLSENKTM